MTVVKIDETRLDEAVGHLSEGRPLKGREAMVAEFTPTFGTLVGMDHCLHELMSVNAVHLQGRIYVFIHNCVAGHACGRIREAPERKDVGIDHRTRGRGERQPATALTLVNVYECSSRLACLLGTN